MLLMMKRASQIHMAQLAHVYEQSNLSQANGMPNIGSEDYRLLEAEIDFYDYLCEFLRDSGTYCAIWSENDRYVAAARIEPYMDGVLLSGLETAQEERGKGIASRLLHDLIQYLAEHGHKRLYSHIAKDNHASISVHVRNGFVRSLDYAKCVDGSVLRNMNTYCLNL